MSQAAVFGAILCIFAVVLVAVLRITSHKNREVRLAPPPEAAELPLAVQEAPTPSAPDAADNSPAAESGDAERPYYYDWDESGSTPYSLSLHRFDEQGEFIGKECDECGQVKWLCDFRPHGPSHDKRTNTCIECENALRIKRVEHMAETIRSQLEEYQRGGEAPAPQDLETRRLAQRLGQLDWELEFLRHHTPAPDAWSQHWIDLYRQRKLVQIAQPGEVPTSTSE